MHDSAAALHEHSPLDTALVAFHAALRRLEALTILSRKASEFHTGVETWS